MSYEPGSLECRLLIEAKESLLKAMQSLNGIQNIESIQAELKSIYRKLEDMHEIRREKEFKN